MCKTLASFMQASKNEEKRMVCLLVLAGEEFTFFTVPCLAYKSRGRRRKERKFKVMPFVFPSHPYS